MQSKSQLDAPDSFGRGNTIIESCKIRSLYTPQDPDTAQWISEALGPKTEVHQQTTYTGHRLAFWLGHIMVADQESGRPLLDAAEVCKLPASDCILLVAGFPPFRVKRLRYYEHADFQARAKMPSLQLRPKAPYPFKPQPRVNPWARRGQGVVVSSPKKSIRAEPSDGWQDRTAEDVIQNELILPTASFEGPIPMDDHTCDRGPSFDLELDEEALKRWRALDELDRLGASRKHHRAIKF